MPEQQYVENSSVGREEISKRRRLPFSGARNFRDLGGYQTSDHRSIRWGRLYRSDGLHKLTAADLRYLSTLGLDRVIDLRSQRERQHEPDRLPAELSGRLVEIPILDSSTQVFYESRKDFVNVLKQIDATEFMIETNVQLATRFTPEMRQIMDVLLSSNGRPVLFHCAAGKDRTGFAAAVILRILGASAETALEDYLLTNQYFLARYQWSLRLLRLVRGTRFAESVRAFMIARPEYLSAGMNAIDARHGSFEQYLHRGLGLTENEIERLKTLYLE